LLKRTPLRFEFPGEFLMSAPRLPAPLHTAFALLLARGLDWGEKWAAIRLMRSLQAGRFRIEPDTTVTKWLDANQTPSRQRRLLWEPLCIAALNTSAERASAQVLANVLRDSLGGAHAASDLLLPQVNLSALFPDPAAKFVAQHGGTVRPGHRVASLRRETDGWHIDETGPYTHVVLAVAPYHLAALVPELAPRVGHFDWEPIVTSYLRYPDTVRLPQSMLGVDAGLAQWLFDRGALCGQHGLIAAVISARGRHLDLPTAELEQRIHEEIARIARPAAAAGGAHHHRKTCHLHLRAGPEASANAHRNPPAVAGRRLRGERLSGDSGSGGQKRRGRGARHCRRLNRRRFKAGSAWPALCAGVEQCSTNSPLRPAPSSRGRRGSVRRPPDSQQQFSKGNRNKFNPAPCR
jgi:hypothetical protein